MPGLGVQHEPAFEEKGGWNETGEYTSNPLARRPPLDRAPHLGGMARGKLESLHAWEHNLGADRARRPFNRGHPQDHAEDRGLDIFGDVNGD